MPIFATLVAACINGLTTFYALVLTTDQAIKFARRTFIIALMLAFCVAVKVCLTMLLGMMSSTFASLPAKLAMGVGMFIPANAAGILACMGAVWLACVIYRLKREGLGW